MRKPWILMVFLMMAACQGRPLGNDEPVDRSDNSITMTTAMGGDASSPPPSGATDGGERPTCDGQPVSSLCSQNPTGSVAVHTPRAMRLNNEAVFVGNYVIDPNVPTGTLRCSSLL